MADLTIAQLTELLAPAVDNLDLLPIWDDSASETKKITINNFRTAVGVTNWSETFSSATQATSRWLPNNAAANVNAAVVPKGTGALLASIPDGTAVGGNARGSYAVDLQMIRNNANQVASGSKSAILSGENNRVSAANSFVGSGKSNSCTDPTWGFSAIGSGESNTISRGWSFIGAGSFNSIGQDGAFIGAGYLNSASGVYSTIVSGQSNTASGNNSVVGGGQSNTASGEQSFVGAGLNNTASGQRSGVLSGWACSATGSRSAVCGGESNNAGCVWGFVGGGSGNSIGGSSVSYNAICGGQSNNANGYGSFIGGGMSNTMNLAYSQRVIGGGRENTQDLGGYQFIGGGYQNRTEGENAFIAGGSQAKTTLTGQSAHANGQFSAKGDAQAHELVWRAAVTGNGITELFLDGASVAAILPGTNCLWQGTIDIAAICTVVGNGTTTLGDAQGTTYKVTIKRLGTATTLVGSVQEIGTMNADPSALGGFTIDANNTNESLRIQYTPPATAGSTTVHRVVATFKGLQIQF